MKSTIVLYYKSLVNAEKNFALVNLGGTPVIENYISGLTKTTISDFQYIKHRLVLSIKINMNQTNLEMVDSKDLNYVRIVNTGEKPVYYFVIDKKWIAKDTIELVLSMDTLNSFKFNADYQVSSKSLVKRMHKDRFYMSIRRIKFPRQFGWTGSIPDEFKDIKQKCYLHFENSETQETFDMSNVEFYFRTRGTLTSLGLSIYNLNEEYSRFIITNWLSEDWKLISLGHTPEVGSSWSITFTDDSSINALWSFIDTCLIRKIDLKSEDIACPVYKVDERQFLEENNIIDWSLYYKNHNDQENSPVECFLVPSDPINIKIQTNTGDITNLNIPNNKYVIFYSTYPAGALTFQTSQGNYNLAYEDKTGKDVCIAAAVFNDNGTIRFFLGQFVWTWYAWLVGGAKGQWTEISTSFVKVLNAPHYIYGYQVDSLPPTSSSNEVKACLYTYNNPSLATKEIDMGALTDYTMYGKSNIDKSLSENIKIINIPYAPTPIEVDNGTYSFDSCWKYDSTMQQMKLIDFTKRFKNTIETDVDSPLLPFEVYDRFEDLDDSELRKHKDSKLFHSDYYRPKFVYDSFSRIFPLEQIDFNESFYKLSIRGELEKFKFDFVMSRNIVSKFLFKFDFEYLHSNEDYPNIVAVSRNNEEVLYSSQYLDYIRTGYNYDLKSKERQEQASTATLGLSILGLVATGAIGIATGNPIAVGGAVASGIGIATSTINLVKTTAQNEENIQRKLAETQRQAVSVLNADDYDLLYEYSNNKSKMCLYKVSNNLEKVLDDLFYYVGYSVNEQIIPNINSRIWFNFVQASLIIEESSNLTTEIENDIKEKFEQGVTFLHPVARYNPFRFEFDFTQTHENWETKLFYKDNLSPIRI